jgi:hypothetical protein
MKLEMKKIAAEKVHFPPRHNEAQIEPNPTGFARE